MEKRTELQEKTFITEFDKQDGKYEGPEIKASSWEEAEAKANTALCVIGVLPTE